jgi:tetratricopeptide (TPR) repeat protein
MEDYARALELDTANPEIYVNRARTNLFLKKYYSCLIDCNKAIELKNNGETVYILRGCAQQGIKRYSGALEDLGKAIAINPASVSAFTQRGLVRLDLEQIDSAIIDLTHAIELDSNNTFALFNRALTRIKKPDPTGALHDLDNVVRLSPYNSYAYYNRAIVLIGLNDKKNAIRDFNFVSKLDPKNIMSYYYRSRLKADLHDYQGALDDLNRTLELLPDYTDAYYDRYEIKNKLKDHQGAIQDYKRAVELAEKNHFNPDSLKSKRKDYFESLTKLSGDFDVMNTTNSKLQNQPVEIQPLPVFDVFLGRADFDKVRLYDAYKKKYYYMHIVVFTNISGLMSDSLSDKEIERQSRRIDSTGGNPGSYYERAIAFASTRNFNRALNDFDTTLKFDSTFLLAYFSRANARYELMQVIQAQEEMKNEVTIARSPQKQQTQVPNSNLEHTYEAVIRDYDRALALDPEFPFGYYNRGFVNCMMGNYHEAVEDFTNAIRYRNDFAEAWYNRGLINILLNENNKGCEDLSRAGELGIIEAYKVMRRYCYK